MVVRKEGDFDENLLQVTHVNTAAPQPIERNSLCHFVPESSSHAAFLVPLVAENSLLTKPGSNAISTLTAVNYVLRVRNVLGVH